MKIKRILEQARKFDWKSLLKNLVKKVVARKKQIYKIVIAVALLALVSWPAAWLALGGNVNRYRWLFVFAILLLVAFFVVYRKKIGQKPEWGFVAVALICGSLLAFSQPRTFISWDDGIHYGNAEKLAASVVPHITKRPKKVESSFALEKQDKLDVEVDAAYNRSKKLLVFSLPKYQEVGYLPAAAALVLGKMLFLPSHLVFVLARWANLLVYAAVIFFAIRKLRSGKMIMVVVALFPTAIFLAVNYSYDWWVNAFTLLGLAYLFSALQQPEKKITKREMVIMLGAFLIGLGPKAIYFLLMLPLFLIKKQQFENVKQYKKFMWASALAVLIVLGSFMLPFVIGGPGKGDRRGGGEVNSTKQVQFVLSEPVAYAKILTNFAKDYVNPMNAGGFTTFFAYLGSFSGLSLILVVVALVTITDKNEFDRETSGWKMKALILGIYAVTVALICTALYVAFTAVKSPTIAGVQPRYLIPLIFPLLFMLGSSRVKNPFNKNWYNLAIFAAMSFVLLRGIWELVVSRYY